MSDVPKAKYMEAGHTGSEVSNCKPYAKNTLQLFLSPFLPSKITLHGCSYRPKDDARCIGAPCQKLTNKRGSVSYRPIVELTSDDAHRRFQEQAIAPGDRYLDAEVAQ